MPWWAHQRPVTPDTRAEVAGGHIARTGTEVGQRAHVTVEHVAGIPVRHPTMVAAGRHYGCKVESCVPFDPESKGGVEATVKIAKRDLVPTTANLRDDYASFAELVAAADAFCEQVNARVAPGDRPGAGGAAGRGTGLVCMCCPPSRTPLALGEERLVDDDQTIRFGSVRYSTPAGHQGSRGVVPGRRRRAGHRRRRRRAGPGRDRPPRLSTPGNPRIVDAHYPHHPAGNGPGPQAPAAQRRRTSLPGPR